MTPIRRRMLEAGAKLGMTAEEMDGRLKIWLQEDGKSCPWFKITPGARCITDGFFYICESMFPRLSMGRCPCYQLSLSYVRRRAREALEE